MQIFDITDMCESCQNKKRRVKTVTERQPKGDRKRFHQGQRRLGSMYQWELIQPASNDQYATCTAPWVARGRTRRAGRGTRPDSCPPSTTQSKTSSPLFHLQPRCWAAGDRSSLAHLSLTALTLQNALFFLGCAVQLGES